MKKKVKTTLHSFFFCDSGSGKCSVCRIAGSAPVDQSVIGGSYFRIHNINLS